MRIRMGFMVAAALTLPLASVVLLEGTAAAKKVTGTGAITCHLSGSLSFNPPLSPSGTKASKETVTVVNPSLSGCSGGTPTGVPAGTSIKPIKIKGTKVGKTKISGRCSDLPAAAGTATVKGKSNWTGEKPSKFTVVGLTFGVDTNGEADFTGHGTVTSSYAGPASVHVDLQPASGTALATCVAGSGGSVSSAAIDGPNSTITL